MVHEHYWGSNKRRQVERFREWITRLKRPDRSVLNSLELLVKELDLAIFYLVQLNHEPRHGPWQSVSMVNISSHQSIIER
ncbi:MAG: hypothetical protein DMG73_21050 [Acidobacteria bacterium]|nr:MAG: hypothetical protein DMG73_21050 [Acidobacteriota bacterium]